MGDTLFKLTGTTIDKILAIYEMLEKELFLYALEYISPGYKVPSMPLDTQKELRVFCEALPNCAVLNIPTYPQIVTALRRFITRCLTAVLQVDHPLIYYIRREDFWPPGLDDEKLDNLEGVFPMTVLLKHTFICYETIERVVNPEIQRKQQMRIGQLKNSEEIMLQMSKHLDDFKARDEQISLQLSQKI